MQKIVIIGNGISGVTAARHIRKKSDAELLIISDETPYFFSRTALMYVFMGHMRKQDIKPYEDWFWKKNRIDLLQDYVSGIKASDSELSLQSGKKIKFDKLIIATGSKPNKFGWPGQDLKGVQGLYSMQDLDNLTKRADEIQRAVIVGGGLIGVELAEMLVSRGIEVVFLVRENRFWGSVLPIEEGSLISNHIQKHHIDLRFNTELDQIFGDENGVVNEIITKDGERISCQFVGLTAGVSPNVEWLKNSAINIDRGIVVNQYFETNFPNIYAIGDCAQFQVPVEGRKNIEQVWYTGRIMGETLAATLTGNRKAYQPGPWFNSAKFFDIEYQTYGNVNANRAANELDFYWQHPTKEIAIHLVWGKSNEIFIGINVFGLRMRHELFNQWLKNKVRIDEVMANLRIANFDPEFYKRYENEILDSFNLQTGKNIRLLKQKWWQKVLG